MSLKRFQAIVIAGLLAPAGAVAQSADGFGSAEAWRGHVAERCRAADGGVKAAHAMFTIAVRVDTDAARRYCDCFASEMTAIVAARGLDWGTTDTLPRGYPNFVNRADRPCFQPYDDGQRPISPRQMSHEQRQEILDAIATP